ncbi:hypothetical protein [Chromobacterium haemolyticum]|uniref:hypothetical protein n=1 Tax=Chromobacterium haemolyticum TaxID=394935 RepID=UPI002446E19F|nr:hypothetical protein [Chromobacterium haemolyticum]MDH0342121.1 hypothetical protein [Chromobacterium haemolyticum]
MHLPQYRQLREMMSVDSNWGRQIEWAETVKRPLTADAMAQELIFVICNSGMNHKVARGIYSRVMPALVAGHHPNTVFHHKGKAAGMMKIWSEREALFEKLGTLQDSDVPAWCGSLPWIGAITKWHAAKNLGADVAKPDRWLVRLANAVGETVDELCGRLSRESNDRVATVDLVLWWALANKHLSISEAGDVVVH